MQKFRKFRFLHRVPDALWGDMISYENVLGVCLNTFWGFIRPGRSSVPFPQRFLTILLWIFASEVTMESRTCMRFHTLKQCIVSIHRCNEFVDEGIFLEIESDSPRMTENWYLKKRILPRGSYFALQNFVYFCLMTIMIKMLFAH